MERAALSLRDSSAHELRYLRARAVIDAEMMRLLITILSPSLLGTAILFQILIYYNLLN